MTITLTTFNDEGDAIESLEIEVSDKAVAFDVYQGESARTEITDIPKEPL